MNTKVRNKLTELFGLDLRSLALYRIGLALLILSDLINRGRFLTAHYTDFGVLPRSAFFRFYPNQAIPSFHIITGTPEVIAFLFLVAAVIAILLLVGYRTQLMVFLSWLFLASLQTRNPVVLQGGDGVFRLLLFWAIFLPLGGTYSLDSALEKRTEKREGAVLSFGTFGFVMQICLIYWFAIYFKWNPAWFSGDAVYYALNLDEFATIFGVAARQYHWLTVFYNWSAFLTELFGPILVLCPFYTQRVRTLGVFSMILLHFLFAVHFRLGLFSPICMVAWLALLPQLFWDKVFAYLGRNKKREITIFYNEKEPDAKKALQIYETFFLLPNTTKTIPSTLGENCFVVVKEGKQETGANAFLLLLKASPLLHPFAFDAYFRCRHLVKKAFTDLSKKKDLIHNFCEHLPQTPVALHCHWYTNLLALICFLAVFIANLDSADIMVKTKPIVDQLDPITTALGMKQKWNMFAIPPKAGGWFVVDATLKSGRHVDLFQRHDPLTWEKPELVSATFITQRWRKYVMNLVDPAHEVHRTFYCQYLRRKWDEAHPNPNEKIDTVSFYYVQQSTEPNNRKGQPTKIHLWTLLSDKPKV